MVESNSQPVSVVSSSAIAVILHYAISGIPRQFEDVYAGFGAELPWITSFLIDSPIYLWIVPLVVIATTILHHFGQIGRASLFVVSVLGTLASYHILMLGLYYPIFLLGRTAAG